MPSALRTLPPWTILAVCALTVPLWVWRIHHGISYARRHLTPSPNCGTGDNFSCEPNYTAIYGYLALNVALAVAFAVLTMQLWRGYDQRIVMVVLYGGMLCLYLLALIAGFRAATTVASAAAVAAIMLLTCLPPTSRWIETRRALRRRSASPTR